MMRHTKALCRFNKGPHIDIPTNMALPGYLEHRGRWSERVGQVAMKDVTDGRELHYDKIRSCLTECGRGLAADGAEKLMLYMPNCPEFIIAMLGAASRGIPVSTANPAYTVNDLTYQLKDSGCNTLLTVPGFEQTAYAAADEVGLPRGAVKVLGEAGTEYFGVRGAGGGVEEPDFSSIDPVKDVGVLPYSSGTTGLSKGVMLSHFNVIANVAQLTSEHDVRLAVGEDSTMLCVLPLFHIYAMVVCGLAPLAVGCKTITMPKFDPELFLKTIQDEKVTITPVVPPIMIFLAKHPLVDSYDLSSLDVLYSAAAPCDSPLQHAVQDRLNAAAVQAYGMTELSPAATASPMDKLSVSNFEDNSDLAYGSCGKVLPATELRIVDVKSGEILGPGEEGELQVRGPQVMLGYHNRPEATAETIDSEGWLRTGDIFKSDDTGHYFAVDRLKELIKVKGFQVAPAELEGLLLTHPSVADCAVIPILDERAGERPHACVVLKPNMEATEEELIQHCAEHTADYKRIELVDFIEAVPKSASGKILRRVLREQYQ